MALARPRSPQPAKFDRAKIAAQRGGGFIAGRLHDQRERLTAIIGMPFREIMAGRGGALARENQGKLPRAVELEAGD
jgi:hypothetical protein